MINILFLLVIRDYLLAFVHMHFCLFIKAFAIPLVHVWFDHVHDKNL